MAINKANSLSHSLSLSSLLRCGTAAYWGLFLRFARCGFAKALYEFWRVRISRLMSPLILVKGDDIRDFRSCVSVCEHVHETASLFSSDNMLYEMKVSYPLEKREVFNTLQSARGVLATSANDGATEIFSRKYSSLFNLIRGAGRRFCCTFTAYAIYEDELMMSLEGSKSIGWISSGRLFNNGNVGRESTAGRSCTLLLGANQRHTHCSQSIIIQYLETLCARSCVCIDLLAHESWRQQQTRGILSTQWLVVAIIIQFKVVFDLNVIASWFLLHMK